MPSYHSKFNQKETTKAWGIPIMEFTPDKGPTLDYTKLKVPLSQIELDIIDEGIIYFRANVLFKNFSIDGDADKLLVYITVFIQKCLEKANVPDINTAKTNMKDLVDGCEYIPKTENFFNILTTQGSPAELSQLQKYLKSVRKEVVGRLTHLLFDDPKTSMDRSFWLGLGKKKFMGYEMQVAKK